jgi:sortase A
VRTALRRIGWSMLSLGVFVLYFLVYLLWGTGAVTEAAQADLRNELNRDAATAQGRRGGKPGPERRVAVGKAVGVLQIPKIKVDEVIVEGSGTEELKKGPGRIPSTKLPGAAGTFAVAGHRTTYGAPFYNLDKLTDGDSIIVKTKIGDYTYKVKRREIVAPTKVSVLDDVRGKNGKPQAQLVLSTCNPKYSAAERLIIFAELASAKAIGA